MLRLVLKCFKLVFKQSLTKRKKNELHYLQTFRQILSYIKNHVFAIGRKLQPTKNYIKQSVQTLYIYLEDLWSTLMVKILNVF